MLQKIAIALLFVSFSVKAQDTVHVNITPNNQYNRLMLYKIVGANQQYVANASIENGAFDFAIPSGNDAGMYRLYFDVSNEGYLDFIYNHESISVAFDSNAPEATAKFTISKENQIYQSYLNAINLEQTKLDSLQYVYFSENNKTLVKEAYKVQFGKTENVQNTFEEKAKGKYAYNLIKGDKRYNSPEIIEVPEKYLESIDGHFFDNIDFGNEDLLNSSFYLDKVVEYVFYLNSSDDTEMQKSLWKESIDNTMQKVGGNYFIKSEILSSLIYAFAGQHEIELVAYVKEKYYSKLPEEYQYPEFIDKINSMVKTAIGIIAPEIIWTEGDKTMLLSELDVAENYIVVFWSTTCSHCLNEIPQLYELTKSMNTVKVVAVALEENRVGFDEHTKTMINWINVLGLEKWENQFALDYDINATPSYFVLDSDKRIIAKPDEFVDVKAYFGGS